ncbi:hypothetical protein ACFX11_032316 [Malus domestica]
MIPSCKAMPAYIFFILLSSIFLDTEASNRNCTSIKCTHDGAPDIRSPFHVRGQHSRHRGHHGYELHCNNNTTLIHFPSYGDLVVKSISYDVRKLDLIDPKNCIHQVFLNLNLSLTPFRYYHSLKEYSYLNCSFRLSPSFTRVPCLSSSGYHVYTVEPSLSVPDSCKVVRTITVPFRYSPYLSDSSFGLGLTWDFLGQQDCEANQVQSISQIETCQQTPAKVGGYKIIPSTTMKHQVIEWEQGWSYMQAGITKLKRIIQGLPEPQFSSEDYMMLYATVYNMCTQNPPYDYSQQLYDKYRETFQNYITSTVLPSLKGKRGEFMLQEFVKSWTNHKVMVRWLSRFFHYLDRYFIADRSLANLDEVGLNSFRDFVYRETKVDARVAVIGLINKEREGRKLTETY